MTTKSSQSDNPFVDKTALVTGANSGLGFEAAAQLAEAGYSRVILACRTLEKAEAAREALAERVGSDPFETIAVDVSSIASAQAASDELVERGTSIDTLLLNAGMVSGEDIEQERRRPRSCVCGVDHRPSRHHGPPPRGWRSSGRCACRDRRLGGGKQRPAGDDGHEALRLRDRCPRRVWRQSARRDDHLCQRREAREVRGHPLLRDDEGLHVLVEAPRWPASSAIASRSSRCRPGPT